MNLQQQEDFLVRNVQKPAREWPPFLKCPPWNIEADSHPQSENINKILQANLDFQRSTVPRIMPVCILHEESYFTVGPMYHNLKTYLASIGDTDTKLEIHFGILPKGMYPDGEPIGPDGPSGCQGLNTLLKCWLELNGQIIQPDFVNQSVYGLQCMFKPEHFKKYTSGMEQMMDSANDRQCLRDMKIVAATKDGFEKVGITNLTGGTRFRLWNGLMTRYLRKEFELDVPDLVEKWNGQCWTCGKKSANLKQCPKCKFAKYCSRTCQIAGRKFDKVLDFRKA